MKRFCCILIFLVSSALSLAQSPIQTVDIKANGTDIRDVLYQLFTQAKKSYVLQPGIHEALNLNLVNVEFDEALQIVCEASSLRADLQNGIYYIGRKGVYKPIRIKPSERENPTGSTLSESVLDRKVTTKFAKAPIKKVIAELARQTHLRIEVDSKVPGYKLDAFLTHLTLREALDRVTKATHLTYELTNRRSIRIFTDLTTAHLDEPLTRNSGN